MKRLETAILSFWLIQWKHYETLYVTQTESDDLLFTSMTDLLFSFLLSVVEGRRIFLAGLKRTALGMCQGLNDLVYFNAVHLNAVHLLCGPLILTE